MDLSSRTTATPIDPSADVAAKGSEISGAERPNVVVDAEPGRKALTLSFYAFDAGAEAGAAPVEVPGVYALVLLDSGKGAPQVPSWDKHELWLQVGESVSFSEADAPRASLRVTVALHIPADVDVSGVTFRVVAGEHSLTESC